MTGVRSVTLADGWASGHNNFNLIRLSAAWLVVYGHAWAITGSAGGDLVTQLTQFKFAGGVAVDVFFFISGFLIAASLERNDTRGYLASRALRILPALVVCVALSVFVLGPVLTTSDDYWRDPSTWHYLWSNGSLWSTRYDLPGVFASLPRNAVNGSLWTLPIEARLYLALLVASMLGVLTARRYTPLWAIALAAACAFAAWRNPLPEWLANYIWCTAFFITGTLCWLQRARIRLSPWPLLALFALAALARGTQWFHLPYFVIACYGTLWLAFVARLPMIRQHDLSYGLYLYGWPSAQLVQQVSPGGPLHNMLWATLLAGALAAVSWFVIERPALRWKRKMGSE
jgi:peptidoglycan/LPS O-acetylase OafA/YrhL